VKNSDSWDQRDKEIFDPSDEESGVFVMSL
jgi:hypothetical protein